MHFKFKHKPTYEPGSFRFREKFAWYPVKYDRKGYTHLIWFKKYWICEKYVYIYNEWVQYDIMGVLKDKPKDKDLTTSFMHENTKPLTKCPEGKNK